MTPDRHRLEAVSTLKPEIYQGWWYSLCPAPALLISALSTQPENCGCSVSNHPFSELFCPGHQTALWRCLSQIIFQRPHSSIVREAWTSAALCPAFLVPSQQGGHTAGKMGQQVCTLTLLASQACSHQKTNKMPLGSGTAPASRPRMRVRACLSVFNQEPSRQQCFFLILKDTRTKHWSCCFPRSSPMKQNIPSCIGSFFYGK